MEPARAAATAADSRSVRIEVNRFVSTLAAAMRVVMLYRLDHKVLDEVMQNLQKRFQTIPVEVTPLRLRINNFSITWNGEKVGAEKIVDQLAGVLRLLGIRELVFVSPVHSRFFHQVLTIVASKDPNEAKLERLLPFLGEGEPKPISLIPVSANVAALRMTDEQVRKRLDAFHLPKAQGGCGWLEEFQQAAFRSLPDLFTWICVKASVAPQGSMDFIRSLTDATREGYFPANRFLGVLPLTPAMRERFSQALAQTPPALVRQPSSLGQRFRRKRRTGAAPKIDWVSHLVGFNGEEIQKRKSFRQASLQQSALEDLDLADTLLKDGGTNMLLGFRFLLRYLGDNHPVAVQEKAFKLAQDVWKKSDQWNDDPAVGSLLSALRQHLSGPATLNITLFALRTATIESDEFMKVTTHLVSLGEAALPSLLKLLESEQDRAMRRKMCTLIANVARQRGSSFLLESLNNSSPFLVRNALMILGDIKEPKAFEAAISLTGHVQKIVRIEALKTLCKLNLPASIPPLMTALQQSPDPEGRKFVLDYLVHVKPAGFFDLLTRLAKDGTTPPEWRRELYTAIATVGGAKARPFFESLTQDRSFLGRFNADQRDDLAHIKTLLAKLPS